MVVGPKLLCTKKRRKQILVSFNLYIIDKCASIPCFYLELTTRTTDCEAGRGVKSVVNRGEKTASVGKFKLLLVAMHNNSLLFVSM